MKRGLATIAWVPMVGIVLVCAAVSGLMIGLTARLIPAVRYLAKVGDGECGEPGRGEVE